MSRRVLAVPTIALLALILTGCGAAQTAATAQDRPSVPGVNVTVSGIAVRNAVVAPTLENYAEGADAPITLALVNETSEPVQLLRIRSASAMSVTVTQVELVGPTAPDTPVPAAGPGPLELAPGAFYTLTLQATGLRNEVSVAGAIPLSLSFGNGAVINLNAPVAPPLEAPDRGVAGNTSQH